MISKFTHYFVISDNWDKAVMTAACYREVRLEMSSGDFGTHMALPLEFMDAMRLADKLGQEYIYHIDNIQEVV